MKRRSSLSKSFKFPRCDYFEETHYRVLQSHSPAELADEVTKELREVTTTAPDGLSRGKRSELLGSLLLASTELTLTFYQAVLTTYWREEEHQLSELAQQAKKLIEAAPDGITVRELRAQLDASMRDILHALRELPKIGIKSTAGDKRYFISQSRINPPVQPTTQQTQ